MQVSSKDTESTPNNKISGFDKKNIIIILLVFVLISASGGIGYYFGFQVGKKQGAGELVKNVTDLLNPINAISNNSSFPFTILGSATDISSDSITVKKASGDKVKIKVDKKTAVTRNSKVIKIEEVKENEGVTVFTDGKGADQIATRIIVK